MRILHTSDWHLGKCIETASRLPEQEEFIEELAEICRDEEIDLILIAGDIFDSSNPPAAAEQLFFRAMKTLSLEGKRPIVIIAGNHDSPERLVAGTPFVLPNGVIILGTPASVVSPGDFTYFSVTDSGPGFLELKIKDETAVLACLPYASEKRLNELITQDFEEAEYQKNYSSLIGQIFEAADTKFRDDTINIAMGHFHTVSGISSRSEREIQVGGIYAAATDALPKKAHYMALGHLHRPQQIHNAPIPAYYSGSPIQYSLSEANQEKSVIIINAAPQLKAEITHKKLRLYKPLELWTAKSTEHALELCKANKDRECWVYLEIHTDLPLTHTDIKEIHNIKKDVLKILPVLKGTQDEETGVLDEASKTIDMEFQEFFESCMDVKPTEELTRLFLKIWSDTE